MENKRFAWLPVRVTSGKQIWLSTYIEHVELYDRNTGRAPIDGFYFVWTETPKERTWRLLKETAQQNRDVWNEIELEKKINYEPTTIQLKNKDRLP
jgi:hypothetical protein